MLPALFSFIVICAILSLFLCIIVRRNYKWTFSDDKIFNLETTLKFIGSIVVTYGMAVFPFTGIYYFDPSLCKVRCKGYMLLGGTPPYVGSATASLIAFCAMPVVVYLFVVVRTKRNEENV
jgi:hypothetical protein